MEELKVLISKTICEMIQEGDIQIETKLERNDYDANLVTYVYGSPEGYRVELSKHSESVDLTDYGTNHSSISNLSRAFKNLDRYGSEL